MYKKAMAHSVACGNAGLVHTLANGTGSIGNGQYQQYLSQHIFLQLIASVLPDTLNLLVLEEPYEALHIVIFS